MTFDSNSILGSELTSLLAFLICFILTRTSRRERKPVTVPHSPQLQAV